MACISWVSDRRILCQLFPYTSRPTSRALTILYDAGPGISQLWRSSAYHRHIIPSKKFPSRQKFHSPFAAKFIFISVKKIESIFTIFLTSPEKNFFLWKKNVLWIFIFALNILGYSINENCSNHTIPSNSNFIESTCEKLIALHLAAILSFNLQITFI